MTVVVTGAAGLLGREVVSALSAGGRDVRAVDLVHPSGPSTEIVHADLTDLGEAIQALRGASAVVHTAAIPRPTGRTAVEVFRTNVMAAHNVVEAAALCGAKRLVNASSFSVLGPPFNPRPLRLEYLPIDENHPLAPQEAYGLSKLITEEIVAAATRRGDLTAVSLRMPWLQTPETFAQEVEAHRDETHVGAANLWAYLDLRDAAHAFLSALEVTVSGHVAIYLAARDTFMDEDTRSLVEANFSDVELRAPLAGHEPLLNTAAAERLLGFQPRYSWRSYAPSVA